MDPHSGAHWMHMVRTLVPLPEKNNRRILSEVERKRLVYRHAWHLWFTPVWWQKRYMKTWGITWFIGALSLITLLLALGIVLTVLLLGIQ